LSSQAFRRLVFEKRFIVSSGGKGSERISFVIKKTGKSLILKISSGIIFNGKNTAFKKFELFFRDSSLFIR
jgi:hypothetical protein